MDASSTWTSSVQLHRRKVSCRPCAWRTSPTLKAPPSSETWSSLDAPADDDDDDARCQSLQVQLELGHVAILRQYATADGHTHDWEVYVRPSEGATSLDALYFVERVEFQLHETYDQRCVVLNEAPFHVVESGYGGFRLPVDVYLRSPCKPRRLHFIYDLQLDSSCSVACVRYEKIVFCNPAEPFRSALRRSGAVSYVSRWRSGLPVSPHLSVTSSAATSGYCSNCSELHDTKTPLRLLGLQSKQRTDDVTRMTSLSSLVTSTSSSQVMTSVKHELDSSLQDMKPVTGGKPGTFLQIWLRQVTSSGAEHIQHHQPCSERVHPCRDIDPSRNAVAATGSSKRRKGRPRKYVAAAGDRTLSDDALLVGVASDSALAKSAIDRTELAQPHQPFNVAQELPPPPPHVDEVPTTSAKRPATKSIKVSRGRETVFRRGRRQPVKFIPTADERSQQMQAPKFRPSKPLVARSRSRSKQRSAAVADAGRATAGPVKRPRGRPRKHPVAVVERPTPPVRTSRVDVQPPVPVEHDRHDDVEGSSSDSDDVIVIGYTAPRHRDDVVVNQQCPTRAGEPGSSRGRGRGKGRGRGGRQTRTTTNTIVEPAALTDAVQPPVKRKRGRPRKYPISGTDDRMLTASAGTQRQQSTDGGKANGGRQRLTRSLTAAQLRYQWDTSRSSVEAIATPPRPVPTPPLYCELSSSDDEQPYLIYRPDTCSNDVRQKRRRRSTSYSRSLELSFSSIEKEDASDERTNDRSSAGGDKMTSTPRYDRSMSSRDLTLRSRWINVEQRSGMTTTTAVVHHDVEGHPAVPRPSLRSAAAATETRRNPAAEPALQHRQRRRRRRSSDGLDPDWRRTEQYQHQRTSRRSSRGETSDAGALTSGQSETMSDMYEGDPAGNASDAELDVLVELQRRLASTTDPRVLRQVVEIIEASGRYQVEDATFDFDLCSLDAGTISKLRRCLAV